MEFPLIWYSFYWTPERLSPPLMQSSLEAKFAFNLSNTLGKLASLIFIAARGMRNLNFLEKKPAAEILTAANFYNFC